MLGFLLNSTSSDNIPGGVATGLDFDIAAFALGVVVGVVITICISGLIKYVKWIKEDNKAMAERLSGVSAATGDTDGEQK